jgi:HD-GYP domain-containing protein (c-di-GMP phosphodiesterase class II)
VAEARKRLAEGAGSQWEPRAIRVFLELLETTPLGQHEPVALPTRKSETDTSGDNADTIAAA